MHVLTSSHRVQVCIQFGKVSLISHFQLACFNKTGWLRDSGRLGRRDSSAGLLGHAYLAAMRTDNVETVLALDRIAASPLKRKQRASLREQAERRHCRRIRQYFGASTDTKRYFGLLENSSKQSFVTACPGRPSLS